MKATEVQGASKKVGAKVVYQGREMTVSVGVDSDGGLKMADLPGITALADALKANGALKSLKCAAHPPSRFGKCQQPLTYPVQCPHAVPRVHSLDGHLLQINQLKGTDPVESIDLSSKRLGVASAIVIASLISANMVTKSLMYAAAGPWPAKSVSSR